VNAKDFESMSDEELDKLAASELVSATPSLEVETQSSGEINFDEMSEEELDQMAADQMLVEEEAPGEDEGDRPGQAALEAYGNTVSLGYLPQLQAKAEPITDRIYNMFSDDENDVEPAPWSQLYSNEEDYIAARDSNINRQVGLAEENPKANFAGQAAGVVNLALMTGGGGAGAAAKQAAKAGAAYGLLANPGDVEGIVDEMQLTPRLRNSVIGAITGAGAQKGVQLIGKYSKPLAQKLMKIAERRAAKALGLQKHLAKKMTQDQIDDVGRYALDEDIIKPSAWNNTGKMIKKNETAMKKSGQMMDDVYQTIDDRGASEFNPLDVAAKADDELGKFWRDPINKAEARQFDNTIETILNRGEGNIPIKVAQELKTKLGKVANWKNKVNVSDKE